MSLQKKLICYILSFSLVGSTSWSSSPSDEGLAARLLSEEVENLVQRPLRPRMSDLLLQPYFSNDIYPEFLRRPQKDLLIRNIKDQLPSIIAGLELAFPNGRYVFLGRDAAFLADLIDGFYIARGEYGRVIRLNVSRASLNESPASLALYLRQEGIALSHWEKQPPFVFLDRTAYQKNPVVFGGTSQLLRLVSVLFKQGQLMGLTPSYLKHHIGAVSLTNAPQHYDVYSYKKYFQDWTLKTHFVGAGLSFVAPQKIMSVAADNFIDDNPLQVDFLPSRSSDLHWNRSFDNLVVGPQGDLVAPVSEEKNHITRARIPFRQATLKALQIGWQIVSSDEFQNHVETIVENNSARGEEFKRRRTHPYTSLRISSNMNYRQRFQLLKMQKASGRNQTELLGELTLIRLDPKLEAIHSTVIGEGRDRANLAADYYFRRLFIELDMLLYFARQAQMTIEASSKEIVLDLYEQTLHLTTLDFQQLIARVALRQEKSDSKDRYLSTYQEALHQVNESHPEFAEKILPDLYAATIESAPIPKAWLKKPRMLYKGSAWIISTALVMGRVFKEKIFFIPAAMFSFTVIRTLLSGTFDANAALSPIVGLGAIAFLAFISTVVHLEIHLKDEFFNRPFKKIKKDPREIVLQQVKVAPSQPPSPKRFLCRYSLSKKSL